MEEHTHDHPAGDNPKAVASVNQAMAEVHGAEASGPAVTVQPSKEVQPFVEVRNNHDVTETLKPLEQHGALVHGENLDPMNVEYKEAPPPESTPVKRKLSRGIISTTANIMRKGFIFISQAFRDETGGSGARTYSATGADLQSIQEHRKAELVLVKGIA